MFPRSFERGHLQSYRLLAYAASSERNTNGKMPPCL